MIKKILLIIYIIGVANYSLAASDKKFDQETFIQLENYLNSITTYTADFYQVTNRGEEAKGKFILSRPGKIKWEYELPTPIIIVGHGTMVAYYDKELDEVSYINLKDTIAGFLTKEKIDLKKDTNILSLDKQDGIIKISFAPKTINDQDRIAKISLTFKQNPLLLEGIAVTDNIGKLTSLSFTNAKQGEVLSKDKFNYPRTKELRR